MISSDNKISEHQLNTNLKEIAFNFIRELSIASRKVTIYGSTHPVATRSIEKPFLLLGQMFCFKKYVNVNLQRGELHILNISIKDDLFGKQIIQYMQMQDISAILFKKEISQLEFIKFIDRFVTRVNSTNSRNYMNDFFKEEKIDTIETNTQLAFQVFEAHPVMRGDVNSDYTVRAIACNQLSDDLNEIAELNKNGVEASEEQVIDFNNDIIQYIIPEKISTISPNKIKSVLNELGKEIHSASSEEKKNKAIEFCVDICKFVEYHPAYDEIMDNVDLGLDEDSLSDSDKIDPSTVTGSIKIESNNKIEEVMELYFSGDSEEIVTSEFVSAFIRLLKTGQRENASQKLNYLLEQLCSTDVLKRQRSLSLLLDTVKSISFTTDKVVYERLVGRVIDFVEEKLETYEFSELIWELILKATVEREYVYVSNLTEAMKERRTIEESVFVYDSMAIKKVFSNLNRKEVLELFTEELVRSKNEASSSIRAILIDIASEEVALALTNIISHPSRSVRQQVLKVLGCLGTPAVKVCSEILNNDSSFKRDEGRHELPDEKWYIVRNAIFVLGLLGIESSVVAIRKRISDLDVRVRREIISTLEKIGGEDACDILAMMVDDTALEIQEKAIMTLGIIGNQELIPLLDNIAHNNSHLAPIAIITIGKIGGDEARSYLENILSDEKVQKDLAGKSSSREDIKLAVIKSLGLIGDEQSIEKIKDFQSKQSTTQKIFLKNSSVNKAINEILSKQ